MAEQPEEKAPEAVISFEDFLQGHPTHPGLVASFTYEEKYGSKGNSLRPRTEGEWILSLETQSNRTY